MGSKGIRALATVALLTVTAGSSAAQGVSGDYLSARQARMTADYGAAVHYYVKALGMDPRNPQLLEGATLSQLSLGDLERAAPIARRMETAGIRSQIASIVLIADEAASGEWDAILARLDRDDGVGPLVNGLMRAWAFVGKGDMSAALAAFDEVGEQRGLRGFSLYHKALALGMVGDYEAAEAIYNGEQDGPLQMTRRGAMARIEVMSQLDMHERAIGLLDQLFGTDLDPALSAMRARLVDGEILPFTHIQQASDGVAEIFYSVAAALRGEASNDYTLLYSRAAEFLRPDHVDAVLLSADLLEKLDRPELAVEAYRRVPRDNPAFHAAELGRAEALRAAGKDDAAIEVLAQLAQSHAELPVVHATMGDFQRRLENFEQAVRAYDRALDLYPSEDPSQWFVHYARGICEERLGDWTEAEADFRTALKLNPEHPQVLNYLGYSLVERSEKLDEALSMIERAAAARPDSGYIIDSLGWVLYRMGRYEEAVGHMETAAALMPVDPVVNDHLGDAYWAVGRHLEAEFQWHRALSFDPEEKDATRIRRKLKVGLDAVLAEEGSPSLQVAGDGG